MTLTVSQNQIRTALSIEFSEAREIARTAKTLAEQLAKWPRIYSSDLFIESEKLCDDYRHHKNQADHKNWLSRGKLLTLKLSNSAKDFWRQYLACEQAFFAVSKSFELAMIRGNADDSLTEVFGILAANGDLRKPEDVAEGRGIQNNIYMQWKRTHKFHSLPHIQSLSPVGKGEDWKRIFRSRDYWSNLD